MIIRPVLARDLADIGALDTSFFTEYVWQMEQKTVGEEVSTTFRSIRLPRSIKVEIQQESDWIDDWQSSDLFLVIEEDGAIAGYLQMEMDRSQNVGKIGHLAVARKQRRLGFGTAILQEAKRWSKVRHVRALVIETQTRNQPAIDFFRKEGFSFCGFIDSWNRNKDIAVFFVCNLG